MFVFLSWFFLFLFGWSRMLAGSHLIRMKKLATIIILVFGVNCFVFSQAKNSKQLKVVAITEYNGVYTIKTLDEARITNPRYLTTDPTQFSSKCPR
jgi:hypothetical membrane protein